MDKALAPLARAVDPRRGALRLLSSRGVPDLMALVSWSALIGVAWMWGRDLNAAGQRMSLHAPPLFGRFRFEATWRLAAAVAFAILVVSLWDRAARRLPWRGVVVAVIGAAFLWSALLAFEDGAAAIGAPLESPFEYLSTARSIDSPTELVATFTQRLSSYPVHVQGHPPGFVLLLYMLERTGFGGPEPAAVLIMLAGASAGGAALIALRAFGGEERARAAAPFMVLAPAAIWIATSADGLYAGVATWAVTLFALSVRRRGGSGDGLALGAGVVAGAALFLSYGVAALAPLPVVIAFVTRRVRPLVLMGAGVVLVGAVAAAAGFWWFDGLAATTMRYQLGAASGRPGGYFALANLAAFCIALGPAVPAGMGHLRDRFVWVLVGGALIAVVAADASGLSKGEVERIWLPFAPWLLVAACALGGSARRVWLGIQATLAIMVQVWVQTPW